MSHTFPKKEKLKGRKRFDQLFAEGKSVTSFPLKLIYLETSLPENVKIQAGVTVSKKKFKRAVDRNRIKRLLREAYRLNKHLVFNNSDSSFAFVFLYLGKEIPSFVEVDKAMKDILAKFLVKQGQKN